MKRLLTLWLTLLGAFWLTRAVVSALLFQSVADRGDGALFLLIAVREAYARPAWPLCAVREKRPAIKAEDITTLNGERVWKVAEPKNGKDS